MKLGIYLDETVREVFEQTLKISDYPSFAHPWDACFDIRASEAGVIPCYLDAQMTGDKLYKVISTGLHFAIPEGYEVQVRSRSGLAYKYGVGLVNGVGTIDAGYVGEVKLILHNLGNAPFQYQIGDRLCQARLAKLEPTEFYNLLEQPMPVNTRGAKGFGSSGIK